MKRGPKYSIAWSHVDAIRASVHAGERYRTIASRYDVSERVISIIAAHHGFARKRGKPPVWPDCPPELRSEYQRMRKNYGLTSAAVKQMMEAA
jgi:hypothetical protein